MTRSRTAKATGLALIVSLFVLGTAPTADARSRDEQPPDVAFTAPAADSSVQGVVTVEGWATDNKGVKTIEVAVDGSSFKKASNVRRSSNWYFKVDTTKYTDGPHDLVVRASDKKRNVGTATLSVLVANTTPEPELVASDSPPTEPTPTEPTPTEPTPTEPTPTEPTPTDPYNMTTPEGTVIEVNSAGSWTAEQVYQLLKENGLDSTIGPRLKVKVQDTYASQVVTSAGTSGGVYTNFNAIMYLKGVNSTFVTKPNDVVGHEYGHVWTLYHLYLSQQADWSRYLEARGLAGDTRLESSYSWSKSEIIADDYRLLFGSDLAISQRPAHLNTQIPDPREVPGLREFFLSTWAVPQS